ncbi:MAG: helix-turn-helix transcriptional regulator [Alphaproteobacteria bacterium]|nr:helix-turn-helix transcriptional regulator [Alphaproteobacteria bacterium]
MQNEAYLTTAEVAAYLRLKERTIYDLVARRAIPCSRVTGKLIFPRRMIDRWVEDNIDMAEIPAAPAPPIVAGSSDPLLEWALRESGSGLATLFEGSEAGLRRLAEGQAVAAGLHLIEAEGTDYNREAARRAAAPADLVLLRWAWRMQGLIVAPGNPLRLGSLADIRACGARLIARQAGSGSRLLLDHLFRASGIGAEQCNLLATTALTEADIAAAIAEGSADCGIAIAAAARGRAVDFVPLWRERFDIACRRRDAFEAPLQKLFEFARSERFRRKAASLGGYDLAGLGQVEFNR